MAADGNAWKQDAEGLYIEMLAGEKKSYSMDWSAELGAAAIATVVWTLPTGVTKLSQAEASPVGQVSLHATGAAGVYACSVKMTSNGASGVPTDVVPFRVVIA
jgi:hypothetical protein